MFCNRADYSTIRAIIAFGINSTICVIIAFGINSTDLTKRVLYTRADYGIIRAIFDIGDIIVNYALLTIRDKGANSTSIFY